MKVSADLACKIIKTHKTPYHDKVLTTGEILFLEFYLKIWSFRKAYNVCRVENVLGANVLFYFRSNLTIWQFYCGKAHFVTKKRGIGYTDHVMIYSCNTYAQLFKNISVFMSRKSRGFFCAKFCRNQATKWNLPSYNASTRMT